MSAALGLAVHEDAESIAAEDLCGERLGDNNLQRARGRVCVRMCVCVSVCVYVCMCVCVQIEYMPPRPRGVWGDEREWQNIVDEVSNYILNQPHRLFNKLTAGFRFEALFFIFSLSLSLSVLTFQQPIFFTCPLTHNVHTHVHTLCQQARARRPLECRRRQQRQRQCNRGRRPRRHGQYHAYPRAQC